MPEWIGDAFVSDTGWTHLERLVDIGNRWAGTDGEEEAASATRDVLNEVGARDVRTEEFEIAGWQRGTSEIQAGETTQHCIALPYSPPAEVEGRLVDIGYGLPADFEAQDIEDAIVLVRSDVPPDAERYIHRTEKYYYAVEHGAAAFVYRNHVEGCLPPTGSISGHTAPDDATSDVVGEIPAVGVSDEVGARLARRFDSDTVAVSVDATIGDRTSRNVHAHLGPRTNDRVLVTSHIDAHDISEGALDNGAGTAILVHIAESLTKREEELQTGVELIAYGSEEIGMAGSEYYASKTNLEDIKAILNMDGVARERTLSLYTHGFTALEDLAERVSTQFRHPIETVSQHAPFSDQWPFAKWGVPTYLAQSKTTDGGRGWGHTYADTIDKIDPRTVREQAILLTDLTVRLADDRLSIGHKSADQVARALEEEDRAEGMKVKGDWPYVN